MGMFDKLFRKIGGDPFYEYRRDRMLPEKYQFGMNCFMDTIDDKVIRDRLYQDIRNNPDGYTISPLNEGPDLGTGIPRLFSVKTNFVLMKLAAVSKGTKNVYKLKKEDIVKLMSARPDLEVSFLTKTGEMMAHAIKTKLKHFDFDRAVKIDSCAVVWSDKSLMNVLYDIEEKEILDEFGDMEIVFDEDLIDKDLQAKVDSKWKQYGLPHWNDINDERFMETLTHALNDELWQIRSRATAALGNIGNSKAVELLIKILRDENEIGEVREAALIAFGEIGDARAIETLVHILTKGEDWKVQGGREAFIPTGMLAVQALAKIDDPKVVEPLIQALKSGDSSVRKDAARALVKIGDARAIEPIIKAFKDETFARSDFIEILGETGDERVIEPLIQTIIGSLRDGDRLSEYVLEDAVNAVRKIDDAKAVEPLTQALGDEDKLVRHRAAKALGKIKGARAVDSLIEALNDKFWNVRSEAVKALGEIGDTRVIEPLKQALKDSDSNVREEAAVALEKVREPRRQFLEHLENLKNKDEKVWIKSVNNLIEMGGIISTGDVVIESLFDALRDENEEVWTKAAYILGKIGKPAVRSSIDALRDENEDVRARAVHILGKIGEPAREALTAILNDKNAVVRQLAALCLKKIGSGTFA